MDSEGAFPPSGADDREVGPLPARPPDRSPSNTSLAPTLIDLPVDGVRLLPAFPPGTLTLAVPTDDVLVVAGLPGAGKSTLLRGSTGPDDVVLDPQLLSDRLRTVLPGVPYGLLRPAVHLAHRIRVLTALSRGTQNLIIHEPGGRYLWRRRLVWFARMRGRTVHLLVVLAEPATAEAGRIRRARTLPAHWAMRHEREWERLRSELTRGWTGSTLAGEGFTGCTFLPRSAVPAVVSLRAPVHEGPVGGVRST
ncbi:MAG: hypothetical protein QG622_1368 [Actinomycetota bacterium]|nr:hypothetical protein [Actinomycetota bacterium]